MSDTPKGKGWPRAAKSVPNRRAGQTRGRKPEPSLEPDDPALEEALRDFLNARYGPASISKAVIDQHIRPALRIAVDTYERAKRRPRTE